MILRIVITACAIFITPTLGKMTPDQFQFFENECFFQGRDNEQFEVNGQEIPLSSTIENFVSLAEKFERANPGIDLKDELEYFISHYLYENIKFSNQAVVQETLLRASTSIIDEIWAVSSNGLTRVDPFSPSEKCSLYYMISHSILEKYDKLQNSRQMASPRNNISDQFRYTELGRAEKKELPVDDYFPQEIGVVAIRGTDAAVSLSKVLLGLLVGIRENTRREVQINYFQREQLDKFKDEMFGDKSVYELPVDKLYSVTIADVLMQAYWSPSERRKLAPNGKWESTFLGETEQRIDGFCPMVYTQKNVKNGGQSRLPSYSYSSVRGAADGVILGLTIPKVLEKTSKVKLSQILRMYYSREGITVADLQIDDINDNHVSFCKRQELMQRIEKKTMEQLVSYGYLIAQTAADVKKTNTEVTSNYDREKNYIFNNVNTEIRDYCTRSPPPPNKPEDFNRDPLLDIIVVMDSSNEPSMFEQQQMIVGYLAKSLDLRYTGSRMTVLLDERNSTDYSSSSNDNGSPRIVLNSILTDAYSSSCVACIVGQYVRNEDSTSLEKEDVIIALNQLLEERRESEKGHSGVNGKVVIFFNFQPDSMNANNKIQGKLESALRDFHLNHQDVAFYAVGINKELLKRFSRNDNSLTIARPDIPPEEVAQEIYKKISTEPALLQYEDCFEARNERAATYENIVSPNTVQHYEMPPKYMNNSKMVTFTFESQNGYINVCRNRATRNAELEAINCLNTTGNAAIEFKVSSPCKNFDSYSCPPIWFSVMGMNSTNGMRPDNRAKNYCEDLKVNGAEKWCRTLDQIKFKVSHDGVRCSGCLISPQIAILFTSLLTYFICKRLTA